MSARINLENIPKFTEEKECTWLYSGEEGIHIIFCEFAKYYLHIELIPNNYPGLGIYWIDKEKDCSPKKMVRDLYADLEVRHDALKLTDKEG
jgi:hypothetical protein